MKHIDNLCSKEFEKRWEHATDEQIRKEAKQVLPKSKKAIAGMIYQPHQHNN